MKFHLSRIKRHPLAAAVAAALALGGGLVASNGYAGTQTANLQVNATISPSCTITTAAVAFGTYVSGAATPAVDGQGSVTVICTIGSTAAIALGQGANPAPGSKDDAPLRQMADGSNRLGYFLYQDSQRKNVWGNTAATDVATSGTGAAVVHTVYGTITANQNKPSGTYIDTVVATVTF
jgi:spore coat protein U-like protein